MKKRFIRTGSLVAAAAILIPAVAYALNIQVGMCVNLGWYSTNGDSSAVMSTLSSNNIKTVRQDFSWDLIQPTPTTWSWSRTDTIMAAAAANGVDVLPILDYVPSWANGGQGRTVVPTDDSGYVNFVKAVFNRYGVNGTFWKTYAGVANPLREAEIWNEPWCRQSWATPNAALYATYVRDASTAIRSIDSTVAILASVDYAWAGSNFWTPQIMAAMPDFSKYVSIADVHLYFTNFGGDNYSGAFDNLTKVRNVLTKYGVTTPMWITECGISATSIDQYENGITGQPLPSASAYAKQANYFIDVLNKVNTLAPTLNIQRFYAFVYQRAVSGSTLVGFMLADSNLKPTPAGTAIFNWVATHPAS